MGGSNNRLKIPKDLRPFVSDYRINVIDLAWLNDEEISHFHGDMRFLVEYLSAARQDKDFNPSDETTEHFDELIQVFSQLSSIKYHEAVNIFTEEEKRKGGVPMNKVLKRMFANARAEGNRIGRAEGRTEGRAEGRAEGKLSVLTTLVGQGTLTLQQAAAFLNIPVEEFQQRAQTMAG